MCSLFTIAVSYFILITYFLKVVFLNTFDAPETMNR